MQLKKLVDYGYIVEVGKSQNDPHRAYYLSEINAVDDM